MPLTPQRSYSLLARFWSLAFIATGLIFAFAPALLSQQMHAAAQLLGLGGDVDMTAWSMWHVIALSLMVAVTMLAWQSAQRPDERGPYVVLQTAKVFSTLTFLLLACTKGGVWLLCALTDGSIALSLFAVRRTFASQPLVAGFARAALPSPGYEVWYGKVDLGDARALWFRYTLLDGAVQQCATWALLFDGDKIHAGKQVWPLRAAQAHGVGLLPALLEPARFANRHTVFQVADSHLDDGNAIGQAGHLRWDLSWQDRGRHFEHTPWLLRQLGLTGTTFRSPLADIRMSGTVWCDDQVVTVNDATGALGHLHGRRHADSWAWTHCNHFDGGQEVVFEAISARIRVLGRLTPPLSSFMLHISGQTHVFSSLKRWRQTRSTWGDGVWHLVAENSALRVVGTVHAPTTAQVALVTYTDTDGSSLWCANSKLASLTLAVHDKRTDRQQTFTSTACAAFEEVSRQPPQRAVTL